MENESSWLAKMRKQLGLTQEDLARAMDVTPRTILNWENKHSEPRLTIRQTKALCRMLQIERVADIPDDLFSGETEATN